MSTCLKSYAIVRAQTYSARSHDAGDKDIDPVTEKETASQQVVWMIERGDLLAPYTRTEEIMLNFDNDDKRLFRLPVYTYIHEEDDQLKPESFRTGQHGMSSSIDVDVVC